MRNIIAALAVAAALVALTYTYSLAADARAENAALRREMANMRGHMHDQAATVRHLTHPAVVQQRQIDYILRQGEFKEQTR